MKKIKKYFMMVVAIVALLIFASLFKGLGLGFGNGFGIGDDESTKQVVDEQEEIEEVEENKNEEIHVKVTISEGDYYYENEKINLTDLISELSEMQSDFTVEIKDDHATKNAYDDLIEKLDKNNISYVEK